MPAEQVIVIRHAEKPTARPRRVGVREDGTPDKESLTVRGWQHAGSLAAVFAGDGAHPPQARLRRPDHIFAAGVGKKRAKVDGRTARVGSHSRRPLETVTPMAARLGLTPVTAHTKGEEAALVAEALARAGTVLICWQHEEIPKIGDLIMGGEYGAVPRRWPKNRYDLIWVFDRKGRRWRFRQFFHGRLAHGK